MTPRRSRKGLLGLAAVSRRPGPRAHRLQRRRRARDRRQPRPAAAAAAATPATPFAMITHETPGDTFWDKIRAGAEQAAKDTGVTLKYSDDPEASKQATLIQSAIDSKVDGIATTLVTPDALIPVGEEGRRRRDPGGQLQLGHRLLQGGRRR